MERLNWGELTMRFAAGRLTIDGEAVHPKPVEFKLSALLGQYPGKGLAAHRIISQIWERSPAEDRGSAPRAKVCLAAHRLRAVAPVNMLKTIE